MERYGDIEPGLWFDVGVKRYTTNTLLVSFLIRLWFDVGVKRYTTGSKAEGVAHSCGLM